VACKFMTNVSTFLVYHCRNSASDPVVSIFHVLLLLWFL
jgi:hypothetical protein